METIYKLLDLKGVKTTKNLAEFAEQNTPEFYNLALEEFFEMNGGEFQLSFDLDVSLYDSLYKLANVKAVRFVLRDYPDVAKGRSYGDVCVDIEIELPKGVIKIKSNVNTKDLDIFAWKYLVPFYLANMSDDILFHESKICKDDEHWTELEQIFRTLDIYEVSKTIPPGADLYAELEKRDEEPQIDEGFLRRWYRILRMAENEVVKSLDGSSWGGYENARREEIFRAKVKAEIPLEEV